MTIYEPDPTLPWVKRIILRTEVGSTAHGTGLPGGEDYDEMAVMIEPWEALFGIDPLRNIEPQWPETITYRPARQIGEQSQPGDYDLVVHTARKFARLAANGNPSILISLFGSVTYMDGLGQELRDLAPAFWCDGARARFLGYARDQRERLLGVRGGKHTNRPKLIEQFGYDTKYAMHMLRLGFQGMEYAQKGRITLPIPGEHGDFLRAVRRGEFSMDEVISRADSNEAALEMMEGSAPERPNFKAINEWLRNAGMAGLAC